MGWLGWIGSVVCSHPVVAAVAVLAATGVAYYNRDAIKKRFSTKAPATSTEPKTAPPQQNGPTESEAKQREEAARKAGYNEGKLEGIKETNAFVLELAKEGAATSEAGLTSMQVAATEMAAVMRASQENRRSTNPLNGGSAFRRRTTEQQQLLQRPVTDSNPSGTDADDEGGPSGAPSARP